MLCTLRAQSAVGSTYPVKDTLEQVSLGLESEEVAKVARRLLSINGKASFEIKGGVGVIFRDDDSASAPGRRQLSYCSK